MKITHPILSNDENVFIIAEAGVNHDGNVNNAKSLIDVALEAGVNAVKFQTWKPGEITGKFAHKVDYLEQSTDSDTSRFELSKKLALSYDDFRVLKEYCDARNIVFLSTPDGFESLDFLVDELDIPIIKVGSTETTHLAYVKAIAQKDRPIILSTGMSTLGEVERCIQIIQQHNQKELILLQCTSEYPAPCDEVNLQAMVTMHKAFGLPVGFSDHTEGMEAAIAAVALGARVIEKHFTIDKSLPGPDHRASMSPEELKQLVKSIRITEKLLGDGIKRPSPAEIRNIPGIRRGVVASKDLKCGTKLTADMLTAKRPFVEIEPAQIDILVGMILNRDLLEDEPVHWDDVR